MSTVTKAANAHTVVATGWTTPENAYATSNDSNYATLATAKNATRSGDFGFPAFTSAEIPDHSTITSVVFYTTYGLTATATGALVGLQARRNSTGETLGSEITRADASMADANGTATGCTLTDLRTANELRVRARATRGNSNTASTAQIDRLYATVTFTENVSAAAGTLSNTASLSAGGAKASGGAGAMSLAATMSLVGVASIANRSGSGTMELSATLSAAGGKGGGAASGAIFPTTIMGALGKKASSKAVGAMALSPAMMGAGTKASGGIGSVSLSAVMALAGIRAGTNRRFRRPDDGGGE